jgi:hypothetical protein
VNRVVRKFRYDVRGLAADGQTWDVRGECSDANGWPDCLSEAMALAFHQLTNGKAVFGKPGVGCRGPYQITLFHFEDIS